MTRAASRDLAARIEDLEGALKAIGRVVADAGTTPKRRIERVLGILSMYDCGPKPATAALPLEGQS